MWLPKLSTKDVNIQSDVQWDSKDLSISSSSPSSMDLSGSQTWVQVRMTGRLRKINTSKNCQIGKFYIVYILA